MEEFDEFAPKAQILLVCCWRARKEVSLLLGELTNRAPMMRKGQSFGLLNFKQVRMFDFRIFLEFNEFVNESKVQI